jgi:hypothetical protein
MVVGKVPFLLGTAMAIVTSTLPNDHQNYVCHLNLPQRAELSKNELFVGLVYQGKDIAFRFIIEYSSLRDFGP